MIKFDFPGVRQVPSPLLHPANVHTVEININVYFTLCLVNNYCIIVIIINTNSHYEVTISPKKKIYREKKSIALYSSAYTLCGVYG